MRKRRSIRPARAIGSQKYPPIGRNANISKPLESIGKISIDASLGSNKAKYETEIDVRNPNSTITQVQEFTLQAGQSMNSFVNIIGEGNTSKATLEISSIPAINLQKRLSYLIQYPPGRK